MTTIDTKEQLRAAQELIAAFESLMVGDKNKDWSTWENGNGRNVGKVIEAKRRKYYKLIGEPK